MRFYYLVRDVAPGTPCSYPVGRCLLFSEVFDNQSEAQKQADRYNEWCDLPRQIHYSVVNWEESRDIYQEADSPLYVELTP